MCVIKGSAQLQSKPLKLVLEVQSKLQLLWAPPPLSPIDMLLFHSWHITFSNYSKHIQGRGRLGGGFRLGLHQKPWSGIQKLLWWVKLNQIYNPTVYRAQTDGEWIECTIQLLSSNYFRNPKAVYIYIFNHFGSLKISYFLLWQVLEVDLFINSFWSCFSRPEIQVSLSKDKNAYFTERSKCGASSSKLFILIWKVDWIVLVSFRPPCLFMQNFNISLHRQHDLLAVLSWRTVCFQLNSYF